MDQSKGLEKLKKENLKTNTSVFKKPGFIYWTVGAGILFLIALFLIGLSIVQFSPIFLGIIFTIIAYYKRKERKKFMRNFANENGLEYAEESSLDSVDARLFEEGSGKSITDVISSKYKEHPIRIYHYRYYVQQGKHSKQYPFTVFEIEFEKTEFPYILLQAKNMRRFGGADVWGEVKDMEFSLEDEFKDTFRLYATEGYEVEVFQIFTPSVLRDLKEKAQNYSIEFSGNKIYIYDDLFIEKEKDLREIYDVSKEIFDSLGPLLNRLHDDFDALHPYYSEN